MNNRPTMKAYLKFVLFPLLVMRAAWRSAPAFGNVFFRRWHAVWRNGWIFIQRLVGYPWISPKEDKS